MAAVTWYPQVPAQRARAVATDVALLVLAAFLLLAGVLTYQAVNQLTVLGHAVVDTGTSITSGFGTAAQAVSGIPVVGGQLSDALHSAGSGTGGELASVGQQGVDKVHQLAIWLGVLVAGVPLLLLAAVAVPWRVRRARALTAARTVLAGWQDPRTAAVVASRAAYSLPYQTLLAHTADPFGDLAAGRYDALVAAALTDAGLSAAGGQRLASTA